MYNYGECEICNTPIEEKSIHQDFRIKDKLVVIENVPTGVCPNTVRHDNCCQVSNSIRNSQGNDQGRT